MLTLWEYIEADFQRDYGIDLGFALETISWRRFQTLLHALSPKGAVACNIGRIAKEARKEADEQSGQSVGAQSFWAGVMMTGRVSRENGDSPPATGMV